MSQKFLINYKLRLLPKSSKFRKLFLWLPMPREEKHKLIGTCVFKPLPSKVSREPKFGNKIAYFELAKSEIGNSFLVEEKFEIEVNFKKDKIKSFNFSDYKQDKNFNIYTEADSYVQSDSRILRSVAREIKGKRKSALPDLKDFYDYILSILRYGYPTFGLYTACQAFDFRIVDCGGFSTLFCAMCRAVGVPARVVSGFFAKTAKNRGFHAWSEFMLPDGSWVPVDLAMAKLKNKDYFSKLHEPRIEFCRGTDFSLMPSLPNSQKASILQMYYLRFDHESDIVDFKVDIELKVKKKLIGLL